MNEKSLLLQVEKVSKGTVYARADVEGQVDPFCSVGNGLFVCVCELGTKAQIIQCVTPSANTKPGHAQLVSL